MVSNAVVFNSPRTVSLPSPQAAIASGDLNNDGIPDLVVGGDPLSTNFFVGKIFVMLGKGNGSFQPPQDYRVGYNSNEVFNAQFVQQIQVADLNNDGKLDVVVAHNGDRSLSNQSEVFITVLPGNGNGTLQVSEGYVFRDSFNQTLVQSFSLADVNGDGLKDIILIVNIGSNLGKFHILKNLGNGIFQDIGRKVIGANIYSIVAENLNDDGYIDFIMTTHLGVFIGYGSDTIFPSTVFEQRDENIFEFGLVVKDFNSDGKMDFAVNPYNTNQIRIFFKGQNGFPQIPVTYETNEILSSFDSLDFDKDGKLDLLLNNRGIFRVAYGNGLGIFQSPEFLCEDPALWGGIYDDFNVDGKIDIGISYGLDVGVILNAPNPSRYYTDFDGDTKSDLTVYRPSSGTWWTLLNNGANYFSTRFGLPTDRTVAGNYDGDNRSDFAVYRDGIWYILQNSDGAVRIEHWGLSEDIPVPSDYDNDGKMNTAVFRPSEGVWYIKTDSGYNAVRWGIATDKPVAADYDGDGKTDIAVYRASEGNWYILRSSDGGYSIQNFGLPEDKPVQSDYDGDGKADIAVYRPSEGVWYISQSSTGAVRYERFGLQEDKPVPNDFDGDSKSDIAVYRLSEGVWYILNSSNNSFNSVRWGISEDIPIKITN